MKRFSVLILTWVALAVAHVGAHGAASVVLLTPEEGALADAPPSLVEIGRDVSDGPEILVVKPESTESGVRSPLTIVVRFVPRPDRPVDLSTFRVVCLKIITIDITRRVLPFVTKDGITVDGASFPAGEYKLGIILGDNGGGVTRKVFTVKVL